MLNDLPRTLTVLLIAAVIGVAAGCTADTSHERVAPAGEAQSPAASAIAANDCAPGPDATSDTTAVDLRMLWGGAWDQDGAEDLLAEWSGTRPEVELTVDSVGTPVDAARALLGSEPPTLAKVPADLVGLLAEAAVIAPLTACNGFTAASSGAGDGDAEPLARAADALGVRDEVRWAVPAGVQTALLLRDRALLRRAGVDADAAPGTLAALREQASAVVLLGVTHPIAGFDPTAATLAEGIGDRPSATVEQYVGLGADGLVQPAGAPSAAPGAGEDAAGSDRLPVGSGDAAFAVVNPSQLWGYAEALAQGQAPAADLAVSALPAGFGPVRPVLGDVWVLSASATPGQSSAAAQLLEWLGRPEQQAALLPLTDLFPTSAAAANEPVLEAYWQRLPLLQDAFRVLVTDPHTVPDSLLGPGTPPSVTHRLGEAAFDGRPLVAAWRDLYIDLSVMATPAEPEDAATTLRCLTEPGDGRVSIADCDPNL